MSASPACRPMARKDWDAVRQIYVEGIGTGHATFETEPPAWDQWDVARSPECRLVAEVNDRVVGFAALTRVSPRPVYRGVQDAMLYVAADARGRGVGSELLSRLVEASEAAGIWTLEAHIFPENAASVRTFANAGFRVVGVQERVGRFRDGRWRDVLVMERRSRVVGVD